MRTFYLFNINSSFTSIYNKKSYNLYKILSKINNSNKNESFIYRNLIKKMVNPINTIKFNNYINKCHINDIYYNNTNNKHILYNQIEISKLYINRKYIKIISNKNISSFFKDLENICDNYFVVDFENKDYFYLKDMMEKLLAE